MKLWNWQRQPKEVRSNSTYRDLDHVAEDLEMAPGQLNYLVHVDLAHRILYFETPKVACTSVKKFMREAFTGEKIGKGFVQHHIHDRGRSPLAQLSHLCRDDLNAALLGGFCRFSFVRNPYTRAMSGYLDKFFGHEREIHLHKIGLGVDDEPSFTDVFMRISEIPEKKRDIHFMSQNYLLGSERIKMSFIGRFEFFARDLETVSRRFYEIAKPNLVDLEAFGRQHAQMADTIPLNDEEKAIVRQAYKSDFERFGYGS